MKEKLNKLAIECLNKAEEYHNYSDDEFVNATIIFFHFFMEKMYEYQIEQGLNQKQMEILAEEAGKSIRQTIKLFSGKDMHNLVKKNKEMNINCKNCG